MLATDHQRFLWHIEGEFQPWSTGSWTHEFLQLVDNDTFQSKEEEEIQTSGDVTSTVSEY